MIKYILLALLLINITLNASDIRLERYANTKTWLQDADSNADSAFNLGLTYHKKIKDYDKAEYWYKKAYKLDNKGTDIIDSLGFLYTHKKNYKEAIKWYKLGVDAGDGDSAFGLALLYEENLKNYPTAIKYYKKAYSLGHIGATYNLAMLYHTTLKEYPNAIIWYKKAHSLGHKSSAYNLAILYKKKLKDIPNAVKWYKKAIDLGDSKALDGLSLLLKDNNLTLATAYVIAGIGNGYTKKETLKYLRNDWKVDEKTIKKAYKLQLKLDIPKHYRGGI
ncbi:tetratricopeptide repeat protein [Sulfurimonas sp.]|uniref:tetratricopeptide repeat protein n=1 Tax=Sulfurimonas sp. TaxID=2022749 RepID=UPI003BAB0E7E